MRLKERLCLSVCQCPFTFQFQTGAIKSHISIRLYRAIVRRFNSKLVRLKVPETAACQGVPHAGFNSKLVRLKVGIPNANRALLIFSFNSKLVRLKGHVRVDRGLL